MIICPRIQKGLNPSGKRSLRKKKVCQDLTLDCTPSRDVQTTFLDHVDLYLQLYRHDFSMLTLLSQQVFLEKMICSVTYTFICSKDERIRPVERRRSLLAVRQCKSRINTRLS